VTVHRKKYLCNKTN